MYKVEWKIEPIEGHRYEIVAQSTFKGISVNIEAEYREGIFWVSPQHWYAKPMVLNVVRELK